MGYVFISYSSKDQDMANSLRKLFMENNVDCWMAPYDIPAGTKYAYVINDAIKGCACLCLVLSDAAQNSVFVEKEVERAISNGKTVIPVMIEDVVLNSGFEFYLGNQQIVAVQTLDKNSHEVIRILTSVIALAGTPRKISPAGEESTLNNSMASRGDIDEGQGNPPVNKLACPQEEPLKQKEDTAPQAVCETSESLEENSEQVPPKETMLPALMEQTDNSSETAGKQAEQAHVKMADSSALEESLLFDEQLDRLIGKRQSVKEPVTPLQRIIEKMLSERYWNHISDHIRLPEKCNSKDASPENSVKEGENFTIPAPKNMKYIGCRIRQNKYNSNTLTTTFSAEILEQTEEFLENGDCDVTFYINAPDPRNGTVVVLFGIDSQEGNIYISNGVLIGNRFLMERDLLIQTFNTSSLLPPNSSATYVSTEEARNYLEDTTLDGTAVIIDLSTCTPVLREVYYGETSKDKKARIQLKHNNAYFVFKLTADEQRSMTDVEIGECYEFSIFGFPRDIIKAVQHYEKANSKIGYYRIAELFKTDPILKDEQLAFEYMLKAAEAGCRTAMLELSEILRSGTGCPVDEAKAEKWREKGEQLQDDSLELAGFTGGDLILEGGVLYTG